jgi:hypothetical protein
LRELQGRHQDHPSPETLLLVVLRLKICSGVLGQGSRNFYVRMPIPKDLQTRLGTPGKPRRERWQSLNTSDPQKAKQEGRPIIEKWEREFANIRRPKQLTEAELQDAIWKRYLWRPCRANFVTINGPASLVWLRLAWRLRGTRRRLGPFE